MSNRIIEPEVKIIADSINPQNVRLTSWVATFPRWILAELNTHRMLSRNVASSRAIPFNKMMDNIIANTAIPSFFGKNQKGMQSVEELPIQTQELIIKTWIDARDSALSYAKLLNDLGLHKQHVNRICENFSYVTAIISGTEYENFFKLRAHPDAQPEFQNLAYKMKALYETNKPVQLKAGEWHVPFGDQIDTTKVYELFNDGSGVSNMSLDEWKTTLTDTKNKIAIARCARVSYLNYEGKDDYAADVKLCDRLFGSVPRHLSPTEHVAQALDSTEFVGNFKGFKQYRKFFADESGTA